MAYISRANAATKTRDVVRDNSIRIDRLNTTHVQYIWWNLMQ